MDPHLPFFDDDAPARRSKWSMLKHAFIKVIDPLGWHYADMSPDKSEDLGLFRLPANAVTTRQLAATPPHRNSADGKALVWAYIGSDDPTRGDSRGSTGLARQIADALGGRMLYVDSKMLEDHFPHTRDVEEKIRKLMVRDGTPDIIMGTQSLTAAMATSLKPTMVVNRYNEYLRHDSTKLVSHDLTPEILADAGRTFNKEYPELPGKIFGVLMASFYSGSERSKMRQLAKLCAHEAAATIFFCPSRRTDDDAYETLVDELKKELHVRGLEDRVHIVAPKFAPMRDGYNPYRGLLDRADHMLLLGDSQSMVSEAVANGRPLYIGAKSDRYSKLQKRGYVRLLSDDVADKPLPEVRLAPISITERIARDLTAEFDRLARLRTIGIREQQAAHKNTPPQNLQPPMVA